MLVGRILTCKNDACWALFCQSMRKAPIQMCAFEASRSECQRECHFFFMLLWLWCSGGAVFAGVRVLFVLLRPLLPPIYAVDLPYRLGQRGWLYSFLGEIPPLAWYPGMCHTTGNAVLSVCRGQPLMCFDSEGYSVESEVKVTCWCMSEVFL